MRFARFTDRILRSGLRPLERASKMYNYASDAGTLHPTCFPLINSSIDPAMLTLLRAELTAQVLN